MSWQDAPLYVRALDLSVQLQQLACGWTPTQMDAAGRRVLAAADGLLCGVTLGLAFPAERAAHQRRADHALHRLRVRVRVGEGTGLLSEGAARHVQGELYEMGRMLGGWRKRQARKRPRENLPPP